MQDKLSSNEKWEKYYSNYKKTLLITLIEFVNEHHFIPTFTNELFKIIKRKKKLKILEPGCGSGLMSAYLAEKNKVTVLDLSKNSLNIAKYNFNKKNVKGNFIEGDLLKMPFKNNSFDVVWNQGVIEHFKDPSRAMKEMIRVTKKDGYVVIFIPAFLSPLHLIWIFLKLLGLKKLWPFDEQDFLSAKKFRKFMKKSRCRNIKIKRLWLKSFNFSQIGYCKKG